MPDVDTVERVKKALAETLGEALDCTRNWDAWHYGTMSDGDFVQVADDDERMEELARAAIAALPPAVPATTPDPAESHVDGWRVRVIEWATDETVKVVQCKGEREAKKIERGMGINMASEYYTEIDNKPRTTTTTTTPDPVAEAAKVILSNRYGGYGNRRAMQAMWNFVHDQHGRHMLPRSHYDGVFQAGLRALTKDGEAGKPLRCAECECKNGGADCKWLITPKETDHA